MTITMHNHDAQPRSSRHFHIARGARHGATRMRHHGSQATASTRASHHMAPGNSDVVQRRVDGRCFYRRFLVGLSGPGDKSVSGAHHGILYCGLFPALLCPELSQLPPYDARAWAADEPSPVGSNSDLRTAAVKRRYFALCSTCLRVGHRSRQDLDSNLHSRIGSCYVDRVGQDRVASRETQ